MRSRVTTRMKWEKKDEIYKVPCYMGRIGSLEAWLRSNVKCYAVREAMTTLEVWLRKKKMCRVARDAMTEDWVA